MSRSSRSEPSPQLWRAESKPKGASEEDEVILPVQGTAVIGASER